MDSSLGLLPSAIAAAAGTCTAEILTLPLDTAKVRLQINSQNNNNNNNNVKTNNVYTNNNISMNHQDIYNKQTINIKNNNTKNVNSSAVFSAKSKNNGGFIKTLYTMVKEEGIASPWKGLSAGLQRQLLYGTLRIGIYGDIRNFYCKNEEQMKHPPLYIKILAGMTSGALSMCIANPTDVVKVRLQGDMKNNNMHNNSVYTPRYKGSFDAYVKIIKTEGIGGLWTGVVPNVMRNCIINAAELAAYDQIKQKILYYNLLNDNIFLHLCAGFLAGFSAVCVGSPVDVTKTRMMNAKKNEYKNVFDVVKKTYANDGIFGFYKGFFPNVYRLGAFNIICFVVYEQVIHYFKKSNSFGYSNNNNNNFKYNEKQANNEHEKDTQK